MATDEEQVEKLKQWWKENGKAVVAGIVIGVGSLIGYRYWIDYQETNAEQASSHFIQMVDAIESGNNDAADEQANRLLNDYGSSEYATMARFALAKILVGAENYEKAQHHLQQVIGNAGDSPLAYVARQRLATVQLQMAKFDLGLKTLSIDFPEQFMASVEELKGDLYASQGNTAEAADAYRKAQQSLPGPANTKFLQQKLDDLEMGSTG
ncbi:MAG: putative negative regulator of RcsB-dependent stress response [Chitinophagales bacterium]|jgi:predicted negative regulator of RcsB-dependent stress response